MSRTESTIKNIAASFGGQIINNLLRMVCRTVFVYVLGKEYLGISSLYTNILTLLSVSELGFSTAITYSLYRPLAENDRGKVTALMSFFKKAYRIIGLTILGAGLCLTPFLSSLMNAETVRINIYLYYLLYLTQTVVSYLFFAYKRTLLDADQKKYIVDLANSVTQIAMNVLQIVILVLLHSFLLYTLLVVVRGIVENLVISHIVDRRYPWLKENHGKLEQQDRKEIFAQVYATALNKIAVAISTSTDNLVISANLGVLLVGLYDNYYLIVVVIQTAVVGMFRAFTASLGNYYVTESRDKSFFLFRSLNLMNWGIVVFCSVCFLTLFQPFIELWIGAEYLLDYSVLLAIVANFSTNYMLSTLQIFKESSGLFVRGKYRPLATAILNLVISLALVRVIGLAGVFLGSVCSRLFTTWWYDVWLVYSVGFQRPPTGYYAGCIGMHLLIWALSGIILWVSSMVKTSLLVTLVLRGMMSVVMVAGVFFLIYGRSAEFRYLLGKGSAMLKRKLSKC